MKTEHDIAAPSTNGYRPDDDFIPDVQSDPELAGLVDAVFSTKIGKNRKANLSPKAAVAIARARTFAAIYNVPELDMLCDILSDTSISVKGRGMDQIVKVLSARIGDGTDSATLDRLRDRVMR